MLVTKSNLGTQILPVLFLRMSNIRVEGVRVYKLGKDVTRKRTGVLDSQKCSAP